MFGILLLSSFGYAQTATVGKDFVLWADIKTSTDFYSADSANITLIQPNGSTFISNEAMQNVATGQFRFNFTPSQTGTWYSYVKFYNSSQDIIAVASDSFTVQNNNFGGLSLNMAGFEGIILLIAITIVLAILLFFAFRLEGEHYVLHLLIIFMSVAMLLLIPKVALDYNDHCGLLPTTMADNGTINYGYVCVENTNTTANTLYKGVALFVIVFGIYALWFGIYSLYKFFARKFGFKVESDDE